MVEAGQTENPVIWCEQIGTPEDPVQCKYEGSTIFQNWTYFLANIYCRLLPNNNRKTVYE